MLLTMVNWPTISACPSSYGRWALPATASTVTWEASEHPHLTHVTLYLLSGAPCNSGLYFCGAWLQVDILKSPCCLQSQSQAAVFKMSPAINGKQGWIMLITITRCMGKRNSQETACCVLGRILALNPALGCPRMTSLGFELCLLSHWVLLGISPYDMPGLVHSAVIPLFPDYSENWEAQSCWVHCLKSHTACV